MSLERTLTVRVERISRQTPEILAFELAHPWGRALPSYEAGAHIDVHMPGGFSRQYSLARAPSERRVVRHWREARGAQPRRLGLDARARARGRPAADQRAAQHLPAARGGQASPAAGGRHRHDAAARHGAGAGGARRGRSRSACSRAARSTWPLPMPCAPRTGAASAPAPRPGRCIADASTWPPCWPSAQPTHAPLRVRPRRLHAGRAQGRRALARGRGAQPSTSPPRPMPTPPPACPSRCTARAARHHACRWPPTRPPSMRCTKSASTSPCRASRACAAPAWWKAMARARSTATICLTRQRAAPQGGAVLLARQGRGTGAAAVSAPLWHHRP